MRNSTLRYTVDVILFISGFILVFTGIIMGLFTASGPGVSELDKYCMQLHRHQWGHIHAIFSIVFASMVLIHLILEWSWIKEKTKKIFKTNWGLSLIVGSSLIILLIGWAITPKVPLEQIFNPAKKKSIIFHEKSQQQGQNLEHQPHPSGSELTGINRVPQIEITGQICLKDIEKRTGIPANRIAKKLGLPDHVPLIERLGMLRKRYGFTIQQVRDTVHTLLNEKKN